MCSRLVSLLFLAAGAWRKGSLAMCVGSFGMMISSHASAEDAPVSSPPEPAHHLTWQPRASETQAGSLPPAALPLHEQRPFAFLLDPSTPAARDIGLNYDLGAGSAVSAERPLPSSLGVAGVTHAFTVDYGFGAHVAPFASLRVVQSTNSRTQGGLGASGGVRWQLTDVDADFRLTLAAAVFREVEGTVGSYARVAASYDLGRLRLATNVHAERAFASGRDSVDVLLLAGASYRVLDEIRIGVEYVGQDLEETLDDEGGAEGGAKHYLGPSLALNMLSDRLLLVAGTGINLATPDSGIMGRVGTLMVF